MNSKLIMALAVIVMVLFSTATAGFSINKHFAKKQYSSAPTGWVNATVTDLHEAWVGQYEGLYIVDVREEEEFTAGHIPGALNFPLSSLERTMKLIPKTGKQLYIHCKGGVRSVRAITEFLAPAGYQNLHNVLLGFDAWVQAGYPVEVLDTSQKMRQSKPCSYQTMRQAEQMKKQTEQSSYALALAAMGL